MKERFVEEFEFDADYYNKMQLEAMEQEYFEWYMRTKQQETNNTNQQVKKKGVWDKELFQL